MNHSEILSYASPELLATAVATAWLNEIEAAHRAGQRHCVALSGGRIAQKLFTTTAIHAAARNTSFAHVHFFWADERCVPPTDPDSNFKVANEFLFQPLRIGVENIHRLRGEEPPEMAVNRAEIELARFACGDSDHRPLLDLIFLGLGEDGHIASLFPQNNVEIMDTSVLFLAVKHAPKPPPNRISLSYSPIFAAKNVWVLVSGAGKEKALTNSLTPNSQMPLGLVIQRRPVKIFSVMNEF